MGTIVQLGTNVPGSLLNRRVGIKWLWSACGNCYACAAGNPQHCPHQHNTSRTKYGTLQEYAIALADFVTLIPDSLKPEIVAPLLCAGLTLAGAVSKIDHLEPGSSVVILGSGGGLGHLGVQIARHKGYSVIAVDAGVEKGELSLSSGSAHYIDYTNTDVVARVKELTGNDGAHAVIIVSGAEDAFMQAPKLVRNTGTLVIVGLPRNDFHLPLSPTEVSARGLVIQGASVGTETDMDMLLELAAQGILVPHIEVVPFEEVPNVFTKLLTQDVVGRYVVRVS